MEHAARGGRREKAYELLRGNMKGKDHLENLGIDGRVILKLFLKG